MREQNVFYQCRQLHSIGNEEKHSLRWCENAPALVGEACTKLNNRTKLFALACGDGERPNDSKFVSRMKRPRQTLLLSDAGRFRIRAGSGGHVKEVVAHPVLSFPFL